MKAEPVEIVYQVEMSVEDYLTFDKNDYLDVVRPRLESLGASKVDYDGHFGAMVQFATEPDAPTAHIVDEIQKLIQEQRDLQE